MLVRKRFAGGTLTLYTRSGPPGVCDAAQVLAADCHRMSLFAPIVVARIVPFEVMA
jgi:hypothetical protein